MDLTNLSIIYLACGAPFAVHYSFRVVERFGFGDLVRSVGVGLAWPAAAAIYLLRRLRDPKPRRGADHESARQIEHYRKMLEAEVDLNGRPDLAFEFRDTVMRYLGLQLARSEPTSFPPDLALLEVASHPTPVIAAACLARRERSRIQFHAESASREFYDSILSVAERNVVDVAVGVAGDLGDDSIALSFRAAEPIETSMERNLARAA